MKTWTWAEVDADAYDPKCRSCRNSMDVCWQQIGEDQWLPSLLQCNTFCPTRVPREWTAYLEAQAEISRLGEDGYDPLPTGNTIVTRKEMP